MSRAKGLATLVAAAMVASLLLIPSVSAEESQTSAQGPTRATNTTVVPLVGEYRNGAPKFEGDLTIRRFVT